MQLEYWDKEPLKNYRLTTEERRVATLLLDYLIQKTTDGIHIDLAMSNLSKIAASIGMTSSEISYRAASIS